MLSRKAVGAAIGRLSSSGGGELPHRLAIAAQHRRHQRRLTAHVLRLQIGAEGNQQIEDVVPVPVDREVQRRLSLFESREPAILVMAEPQSTWGR